MRRASVRAVGRIMLTMCGFRWSLWDRYEEAAQSTNFREFSVTTGTTSLMTWILKMLAIIACHVTG